MKSGEIGRAFMSNDDKKTLNDKQVLSFSKIQLVVYYQCSVLIG